MDLFGSLLKFIGWVLSTYFQIVSWAVLIGFVVSMFLIVTVGWILGRFINNVRL